MMLGTADSLPEMPKSKPVFLEDLNNAQLAQALKMPAGLKNLGYPFYNIVDML